MRRSEDGTRLPGTPTEILHEDEWASILAQELVSWLGGTEGGESYRRGDDLLYMHYPNGGPEYVLRRGYFRTVRP